MVQTILTKHQKLLTLERVTGKLVWFREIEGTAQHAIQHELWREMGSPVQITYSLEAGDKLNAEG